MGAFTSRQNAAVEEAEQNASNAYKYKYPPRSGNFFGSHFIMGGERFDQTQPESYLFGENADLNFLGSRPTAFPYPPPQANEPTKTLKSLVNIRKESVRFVRTLQDKYSDSVISGINNDESDGNICSTAGEGTQISSTYNIEFTFDSDAKCAITIYYFCVEEVSPSGVTLMPNANGLTSETYHYDKGINQFFSQPSHVFNPQLIPEDDLIYNPSKEQYPVAIHCVVEEGNEDCRQSHTTICVIDHHPDSNSYSLRALKQKIFVDGLCYLLQEIYGIENKAVNKSSIDDEEIDDHGSECVICMSETRDTLILPCRHLCLCNSCADSLRYQANNCPICRAPFRALLQIRAVQKGISTHMMHQNVPAGGTGEPTPCDQHIPSGYFPVSLIESLNGPPQYVTRSRATDGDCTDGSIAPPNPADGGHKTNSPHKPNGQRRPKIKKNASTSTTNNSDTGQRTSLNNANPTVAIEIGNEETTETSSASVQKKPSSSSSSSAATGLATAEKIDKSSSRNSQDKLHIVNERSSLKLPKSKRSGSNSNVISTHNSSTGGDDDDSENEKLSPLLSPSSRCKSAPSQSGKVLNISDLDSAGNGSDDNDQGEEMELQQKSGALKMHKCGESKSGPCHETKSIENVVENVGMNAEDSDYYTPEDTQNSILSPLCPDRIKSADKLSSLKGNSGSIRGGVNNLAKKNLHKKSTSVGNIMGPAGDASSSNVGELKGNVSSLPDMLDSPISGNNASTRSSSDSYSSSSSTKQLLSSNNTTAAANIIVDDKTALQNAVNV